MTTIHSTGFDSEGTLLISGETTCPKGHKWTWEAYTLNTPAVTHCAICHGLPNADNR